MTVTKSVLGNVEIPQAPEQSKPIPGSPADTQKLSRYMRNKMEAERLAKVVAERKAAKKSKLPDLSFGLGAGEGIMSTKALKRIRKPSKPDGKLSKREHKLAVHKAAVKQILKDKQEPEKGGGSMYGACSYCGKPLTRPGSIAQGMGDVCAHNQGALPSGVSRAEYVASLTVIELPKGYVQLKEVFATAKKAGISLSRVMRASGGHGGIRPPLNEHFRSIFCKGKRYLPGSALKHLADLEAK